jgi:hypothetical protein
MHPLRLRELALVVVRFASARQSESFRCEFLESRCGSEGPRCDAGRRLNHLCLAGEVNPCIGLLAEAEDLHGGRLSFQEMRSPVDESVWPRG